MGMLKEAQQQQQLAGTLQLCRQLAVSYAGLILTLDMFPQVGGWVGVGGRVGGWVCPVGMCLWEGVCSAAAGTRAACRRRPCC